MRPKKRILLIGKDGTRRSILRFVLTVHGYRVEVVPTVNAARMYVSFHPDFIIAQWPANEDQLARFSDANYCCYLILVEKDEVPVQIITDSILTGKRCCAVNILNAVKEGTRRKRGPRKFSGKLPPKKPPMREDPHEAEIRRFEQDLEWLVEYSETMPIAAHRERIGRLVERLEESLIGKQKDAVHKGGRAA